MSLYIQDRKKQSVHCYETNVTIEKAIETLLSQMDDVVSSELDDGYEILIRSICEEKPSGNDSKHPARWLRGTHPTCSRCGYSLDTMRLLELCPACGATMKIWTESENE